MSKIETKIETKQDQITFDIIGKVSSPFKEKFAIPRQPGLANCAKGVITLLNTANNQDLVRGIEQFSHLWLLFIFHGTKEQGWKPLVRPPRLGGNKKIGVLATRSTFRPNPIGMSVVKLDEVITSPTEVKLLISGIDLLDQTPLVDIKPYIPYSDSIVDAQAGYAQSEPDAVLDVTFSNSALESLQKTQISHPQLLKLISQVLAQDPRPAYKKKGEDNNEYGICLYDFNIKWRLISASLIEVFQVS